MLTLPAFGDWECTFHFASTKKLPKKRRSVNPNGSTANREPSTPSNPDSQGIIPIDIDTQHVVRNDMDDLLGDVEMSFADDYTAMQSWLDDAMAPDTIDSLLALDTKNPSSLEESPVDRPSNPGSFGGRTKRQAPCLNRPKPLSASIVPNSSTTPQMLSIPYRNHLEDRLEKIYEKVSARAFMNFLSDNTNPLAATNTYFFFHPSMDIASHSGNEFPSSVLGNVTGVGVVYFLDRFMDLYLGNPSSPSSEDSEYALKCAIRAFSAQYLPVAENFASLKSAQLQDGGEATLLGNEGSTLLFTKAWFAARSSLQNLQSLQSFRVVFAVFIFDMTVVPKETFEEPLAYERHTMLLNSALDTLQRLSSQIRSCYSIVGVDSVCASMLESCLSIVQWLAYIRETANAITRNFPPFCPDIQDTRTGMFV